MPSQLAPRAPRVVLIVSMGAALFTLACGSAGEDAAVQARAVASSEPIDPPIPCAIVSGPEEARTITQLETKEGRVTRVVTLAEQREGRIIWEQTLNYDDAGRLSSVSKTVSGSELSLGVRDVTRFEYSASGQLEASIRKDMIGRTHEQRWIYADASERPAAVEVRMNDALVQRLRFDYEGAPVWRAPLFLPSPQFGAAHSYAEGEEGGAVALESSRYDLTTGALTEVVYATGERAQYLYADACTATK